LFIWNIIHAQTDTVEISNIKMDLLKTPTNPAFILMNTSPTEITEPGSSPEFITSVQNASHNFSAIPNNFGFVVTPYWWTKQAKRLSFDKDFDTTYSFTFFRTTSISGGIVQGIGEDKNLRRYGFGFQTTLLRGKINGKKKTAYFEKLRKYHRDFYNDINEYYKKNTEYILLDAERIRLQLREEEITHQQIIGSIDSIIADRQKQELYLSLTKTMKKLIKLKYKLDKEFHEQKKYLSSNKELDEKFNEMNNRSGLKWDIGGGFSMNSFNNKIDSTGLYRAGLWSNIGFSIPKKDSSTSEFSTFILARYFYYNEIYYQKGEIIELIDGLHTLDLGLKLQLDILNKLQVGIEAVYRTGLANSVYESTYKINGLIQYQMKNNRLIYASIGNNFNDQSSAGPEDLIVTFGLNIGFGGNIDVYDIKL